MVYFVFFGDLLGYGGLANAWRPQDAHFKRLQKWTRECGSVVVFSIAWTYDQVPRDFVLFDDFANILTEASLAVPFDLHAFTDEGGFQAQINHYHIEIGLLKQATNIPVQTATSQLC
jgi:hypothetical protein